MTIEDMVDRGTFVPASDDLVTRDPLGYPGYAPAVERALATSGADESVAAGRATIKGHDIELATFEFRFLGGSMGEVAGERLALGLERAARRGVPFVLSTATGGARMQEGMRSLVQMPKVITARLELADKHQPLLAILGNPTMGGVFASLGSLADVTLAHAGAAIGFAGPRLVQRFTHRPLDSGSHTAEAALAHGLVDAIAPPEQMPAQIARVLDVLREDDSPAEDPRPIALRGGGQGQDLDAWSAVRAARASDRLTGAGLIVALSDEVVELRGDRAGRDDPGVHAALARVGGRRALLLALDREQPAGPAGCRKALRCLEIAARLRLPVVTLIDTAGLDPSETSEAGGIAHAIARLFEAMLLVPVPTLAVVTGEGGSGGALSFAVADVLIALSDSTFSVIGPESAAEILWRDPSRAEQAARLLKLTASDLLRFGIADALVDGPPTAASLRRAVNYHLARCAAMPGWETERVARRRRRWRGDG